MDGTFFSVITWGCSASAWAAKLLNAHPEVFCVHGMGKKAQWKWPGENRDPEPIGTSGNLLTYCRCLLQRANAYSVIGDVHSIPAHAWDRLRHELFPSTKKRWQLRGAVLVRHPIVRVESACRLDREHRQERLQRPNHRHKYEASWRHARRQGWHFAPDDYDALVFHWYCRMAAEHVLAEQATGCRFFRMEELVANPEAAQALLIELSAGRLRFPSSVLEHMYAQRVNQHRPAGATTDPESIFLSWPDWKREIFTRILSSRSLEIYAGLGYEFPAEHGLTQAA